MLAMPSISASNHHGTTGIVSAGAAPAVTVRMAVSQIVVFGAGAHTLYVTVQLDPVVPG